MNLTASELQAAWCPVHGADKNSSSLPARTNLAVPAKCGLNLHFEFSMEQNCLRQNGCKRWQNLLRLLQFYCRPSVGTDTANLWLKFDCL